MTTPAARHRATCAVCAALPDNPHAPVAVVFHDPEVLGTDGAYLVTVAADGAIYLAHKPAGQAAWSTPAVPA